MSFLSTRTSTEKIAFVTGLCGATLGMVVWGSYHWGGSLLWGVIQLPSVYTPSNAYVDGLSINDVHSIKLIYYVFLFVPACLAITSVLFNKKHLMYLAIFLHLPIGDYIGGGNGFGSFATIQIVWFLYVISAILMTISIKGKTLTGVK